jgi:hypothetical protein
VDYGFKCVEGVSDAWQARDYELLTAAWREAVRRRQRQDLLEDVRMPTVMPARGEAEEVPA